MPLGSGRINGVTDLGVRKNSDIGLEVRLGTAAVCHRSAREAHGYGRQAPSRGGPPELYSRQLRRALNSAGRPYIDRDMEHRPQFQTSERRRLPAGHRSGGSLQ